MQVKICKLRLAHLPARQNVNAVLDASCRGREARRSDELPARAAGELVDYRPQLAPLDLSSRAEAAVGSYCYRPRWSSGPLRVEIVAERGDQRLEVNFGYRALWAQLLPAKWRTSGRPQSSSAVPRGCRRYRSVGAAELIAAAAELAEVSATIQAEILDADPGEVAA